MEMSILLFAFITNRRERKGPTHEATDIIHKEFPYSADYLVLSASQITQVDRKIKKTRRQ